jgi:hypothetical protein
MNILPQKVPRSFIENSEEWIQSSIVSDSHLQRWEKRGSNLVATSSPGSLYCDVNIENDESTGSSGILGNFPEHNQDRDNGARVPGVNDLHSSKDMLAKMLRQHGPHYQQATNIRNYLSSSYLNPRLKLGLGSFLPFSRK